MHARLFNKPHLGVGTACTLALTGTLPEYGSSVAYTGTLQVSGGNGSVRLVSWNGNLPPGADVHFDATNKQIIVTWPAFASGYIDLDNLNFEAGDTRWDLGAGWSIMQGVTAPDPNDDGSTWQAQYADQGGSSEFMSHRAIPATPGKTYTASVDVQQGATSANNAGAAVRIAFFDAAGKRTAFDGSVVKSGSNSEWHTSDISVECPADAVTVRLGAVAFRKRENHPLWVDNFAWNGAYQAPSLGTNASADIPFNVTVADEDNCRAVWQGVIHGHPANIIANITFESGDFADSTGRVWTVDSGTVRDTNDSHPITEPTVIANPVGSGLVMTKCPDTDAIDGTFDYSGLENLGLRTDFGDDAPGLEDFCIEMDVRLNAHTITTNESESFLALYANSGSKTTFGARVASTAPMENTIVSGALTRTLWNPPDVIPGQWFHFAVFRKGDQLACKYNGVTYAVYSGASSLNLSPTDSVVVGHGDGTIANTMGWPGQFDNILITRGWAKYTP